VPNKNRVAWGTINPTNPIKPPTLTELAANRVADAPIKHLERNKEFPKPTDNSSPKPNKFNCLESNNPTTKAKTIGGPANLISVHPLELRLPINQVKAA